MGIGWVVCGYRLDGVWVYAGWCVGTGWWCVSILWVVCGYKLGGVWV